MKTYIYQFFLAVILLFSSCQDYLDLTSPSSLDEQYVFSTVSNAQSAVMGVYNRLLIYENDPIQSFPFTADDAMGSYNGALRNADRSIYRYDLRATNTRLAPTFNGFYSGIDRANDCIKQIPQMSLYNDGTEDQQKNLRRLHGESLTLRSFFYFELVKNWGDLPASFEPSSDQKDLFLKKTDRQLIYDRILSDLEEAITLLPWINDSGENDERITKGAAMALRARIALFAGGFALRSNGMMERSDNYIDYYKIAEYECLKLMERRDMHDLNPDYENIFRSITTSQRDPFGEVLFEIGFSATHAGSLGYFDGPRYFFPDDNKNAFGSEKIFMMPTFFYSFDSLDVRRDVSNAPYRVYLDTNIKEGRGLSTIRNGKFRVDWMNEVPFRTSRTGINWPVIRFSDVLLMYAESNNEINNGPTVQAINAFEEVRKRGFKGNEGEIGITPGDKEGFFEAIVNERLIEFGAEGIRKYDLIRWNLLSTKLKETKDNLIKMRDQEPPFDNIPKYMYLKSDSKEMIWGNSFYKADAGSRPSGYTSVPWQVSIGALIIDNYAPFFEENLNELFPIPQSSLNANPNLKQNFGYEYEDE